MPFVSFGNSLVSYSQGTFAILGKWIKRTNLLVFIHLFTLIGDIVTTA